MLLRDLDLSVLPYLERYVNSGSPSGFTGLYTTSPDTSPFGASPYIRPYVCEAATERFSTFGSIPTFDEFTGTQGDNWLLVHPDMRAVDIFHSKGVTFFESADIELVPTASGRTLEVANSVNHGYFKLHYAGILGRIPRDLGFKKAIAGPEVSAVLGALIAGKKLDSRVMLMRETGARIFLGRRDRETVEWGMVWREKQPYSLDPDRAKFILPVFSLFARDTRAPQDMPLLEQIIKQRGEDPASFVLERLIFPLIDCYFSVIQHSGLQPEWHAQNLLVAFASDFTPIGFVMRDLESTDKDLTLMESINLGVTFRSHPFKCIWQGQWNYRIKHSFMYDYKLGEYVLQPLLDFARVFFNVDPLPLRNTIRTYAQQHIDKLPGDFFPRGWYAFERVLIDQSTDRRPYLRNRHPKFRF